MHEQLKKVVSEEIVDVDDVQAILKSDFKGMLEYKDTTREELSDSSNRIILNVINKNNRLRYKLKIVINNKCKILNEELNELKYKYHYITKSNNSNEI